MVTGTMLPFWLTIAVAVVAPLPSKVCVPTPANGPARAYAVNRPSEDQSVGNFGPSVSATRFAVHRSVLRGRGASADHRPG
jgi:hypothetical protein